MGKIGNFLKKATGTVGKVWAATLPYTAAAAGAIVGVPPQAGFAAGQAASGAIKSFLPGVKTDTADQLGGALVSVMGQPAATSSGQLQAGGIVKNLALGLGLNENQSSIAGAIAHAAAGLHLEDATTALNQAAQTVELDIKPEGQGFLGGIITKQEAKDVLDSTVAGVKTGVMTGIMDKTEIGRQGVKDATNAKIEDSMPMILLGVVVLLVLNMSGVFKKIFR